jgi:predicted dithiol-disulfide oxidoreductase (DUF899 family)
MLNRLETTKHQIVSREDWVAARKWLLEREKEMTRLRDRLSAERRALPWVKIEKQYVFDTPAGRKTLADLFDGRSQLFVQHFMFAPDWEEGCVGCSFMADHVDGADMHLRHHDLTYVAIARAPLAKLETYRKRMGWRFMFASSHGSDFNYDFQVSFTREDLAKGKVEYNYAMTDASIEELPGVSVFFKDENGDIYHTYSSYGRGTEEVMGAYMLLDMTPKGRNETVNGNLMDWVKRHDEYAQSDEAPACCHSARAGAA